MFTGPVRALSLSRAAHATALPTGTVEVPGLGVTADLSKMLVFPAPRPETLKASAAVLRHYLNDADTTSIGYGLKPPQSVFNDHRELVARFPGSNPEEALQWVNRFAAQLKSPRRFQLADLPSPVNGTIPLGTANPGPDGKPKWTWSLFDPGLLPNQALRDFINLTAPAVTVGPPIAASAQRLGSWPDSPVAKQALKPAGFNRWSHAPNANCDQLAALLLYPELKNWAFFEYSPLILSDKAEGTRGHALLMPEQTAILEAMRQTLPADAKPLFTPDAPLQTGSIVYLVGRGFNLGHVATVLGVIHEPGKPVDFLVVEKPNPGLLPTRLSRLSEVLKQHPDTPLPPPTYNPTGAPLPPRPRVPRLIGPEGPASTTSGWAPPT